MTDELTGLANHGRFQELLSAEIDQVRRYEHPVGLIMLDIDDFKQVNDTWGHEAGDDVLRGVARILSGCVRPTDLVSRWGGEEFLLILSNMQSSLFELGKIAERCRKKIGANEIGSGSIQVSASFGATLLLSTDSAEAALKRADDLLYRSKNSGRNQIAVG